MKVVRHTLVDCLAERIQKPGLGVFLPLKIVFIIAYSADPDEMLSYAALDLGLHCLSKYLFTGIQNESG